LSLTEPKFLLNAHAIPEFRIDDEARMLVLLQCPAGSLQALAVPLHDVVVADDALMDEAVRLLQEEPLIASLQGVLYALTGREEQALDCMTRALASPKSFGHAHHTYYQIACILALIGRRETAFEWLERSVSSGFACWPFFQKDHCLWNLRGLPEFELLVSSLQAKYPDHLGLL
jgi:tetratricopeptide (TPR) repeat protein